MSMCVVFQGYTLLFEVYPSHWVCEPALFVACPKPGQIGRVAAEKAFGVKWGDDGGWGTDSLDSG